MPKTHPPGLGALPTLSGTGSNQLALELRKSPKDGQHEPAVRCRGVCPGTRQRLEASPGLANRRVEDIEQVPRRTGEPIEPRGHEHVAPASHLSTLAS